MRIVQVPEDTTLDRLGRTLLPGRPARDALKEAVERLRAANPQADPAQLAAGTVLFLPEGAGFEAEAGSAAPTSRPAEGLQLLAATAFAAAERDLGARLEARKLERDALRAALDGDVFRRFADRDASLRIQGDDALTGLVKEEEEDASAEAELSRISKAALTALSRLHGQDT